VMVLKEVRTTFRERSQMLGLVVAVIMLFVIVTASLLPALGALRLRGMATTGPATQTSATQPEVAGPPIPAMKQNKSMRLIAVSVVAAIGFFFSCGYLFAATLATFVGEKEAKTLEILLASPLSDRKLYLVKCISVLLPSLTMALGFSIGVSALLLLLIPHNVVESTVQLVLMAVLLSAPAIALFQLWFVGIGAAISARTETMKGAGQVLGVVFLVLVFGTVYGLPLLATLVPSLIAPAIGVLRTLGEAGFAVDYLIVLMFLAVPAMVFIGVGRWSFRRDRMLT